jgi:hypothetical protein
MSIVVLYVFFNFKVGNGKAKDYELNYSKHFPNLICP